MWGLKARERKVCISLGFGQWRHADRPLGGHHMAQLAAKRQVRGASGNK